MTTNTHIAARLRSACNDVRRKSMPLADLIPMMQEAADALEAAELGEGLKPCRHGHIHCLACMNNRPPQAPALDAQGLFQPALRYISDVLATGTPTECVIARTVMHLLPLEAISAPPPAVGKPLSERQIVKCLVEASCIGTVKMSYDSGPYEITRTSINAERFARAIERAHGIVTKETGNG